MQRIAHEPILADVLNLVNSGTCIGAKIKVHCRTCLLAELLAYYMTWD